MRAYRETAYGASGTVAWIGRRSQAVERLLGPAGGAFVTAWNPQSRRQPEGRNLRMNRALAEHLRRYPHWLGVGQGRGWQEQHFLVRGDLRPITVLARRFRQRAIVLVAPPRPARLLLLPSAHGVRSSTPVLRGSIAEARIDARGGTRL